MMDKKEIRRIIEENPEYQEKLFSRGFIYSEKEVDAHKYPFLGEWKSETIFVQGEKYGTLLVDERLGCYMVSSDTFTIVLIGHAYNPFSGEFLEEKILARLVSTKNAEMFFEIFNQLTGIFTLLIFKSSDIYILGDACGIQSTFFGLIEGKRYISSHVNLIGEILDLEWDSYVKDLVGYKFFSLLGNSLPGDLTQFSKIKRLTPNHYIILSATEIKINRFFYPKKLSYEKEEIIRKVAEILHDNLELITKKWKKPAISMTGGCDSKTTIACAKGLYHKYMYFSYVSSQEEKIDADGAKQICERLGLEHKTYFIPKDDKMFSKIECDRAVLFWNTGAVRKNNSNDVRKRAYFSRINDFDVEVKSWCSEVGRAYYSKRFGGRRMFGKITPRKCTTLYKFFLHNRKLVRRTDRIFELWLKKYFHQAEQDPISWQEQFFWEFRVPSWNGLVITGEHRYSFDITIPYNNRILLELLLSASTRDKIEDNIYRLIREKMNSEIDATGVSIVNLKHTKNRARMENLYYIIHSKWPF